VVATILIIAAVAMPKPLQSMMAADEGEAWVRFSHALKPPLAITASSQYTPLEIVSAPPAPSLFLLPAKPSAR